MWEEKLFIVAGVGVCLFTILLVVYTVFLRRKPFLEDITAHWFLMFAFIVLSPLAYLLSFAEVFKESKSVSFCNSCHVMESRVENLRDPDSEFLAAQHFKYRWIANNQCYQCHTDYRMFGGVQAKLSGFWHLWAYYVTGYELPLKIYGTYNNKICLYCHGPVLDYQEVEEHQEHFRDLELSKKSCQGSDCHVSPHPKEKEKNGI
jgi:cytochrome c nitrite reductase small subunit